MVTYQKVLVICLILVGCLIGFMLKLKYEEFLHIRKREVDDAIRILKHCEDGGFFQVGGKQVANFCDERSTIASKSPYEMAVKDTICFALPFMSVFDRDTSESMVDSIFENEKLIRIGVVIIALYLVGFWFGIFRPSLQQQYANTLVLPYQTDGSSHCNSVVRYKNKLQ